MRHVWLMGLLVTVQPAASALAQTVRGRVTADGSGAPVPGAVVQLVGTDEEGVVGTLSGPDGAYLVRAPQPGSYRLRVERIGFGSRTSGTIDLGVGSEIDFPLTISAEPVLLAGITARGQPRGCLLRDSGETVARVWDEARKALNAVQISQAQGLVFFDTEAFRREIDPRTRQVRHEQRRSTYGTAGNPFRSIPVDELTRRGYVREFSDSTVYYGPDAAVLLSDAFLDGHCFRIRDSAEDESLIGLEFTPVRGTSTPDIEGVLWLDRRSSELRSVDYRYVGHRLDVAGDVPAGRIEFEPVPTGAWIVRRWVIRMPLLEQQTNRWTNPGSGALEERSQTIVTGLVEEGGEVVSIRKRPYAPAGGATVAVTGLVMDSIAARPLQGALVYLSGTGHADTTDRAGSFEIRGVSPGRYVASFTHPLLAALGVVPPQQPISLEAGQDLVVDLAMPSAGSILARYCPRSAPDRSGMVAGYVRERGSGDPVDGARVRARWTTDSSLVGESLTRPGAGTRAVTAEGARFDVTVREMEVSADSRGFYRLCGTPAEGEAEIEAAAGGDARSRPVRVRLAPLVARDLAL